MVIYSGRRHPDGCEVGVREPGGRPQLLRLRLDLRKHSPTGFEWGYEGSGPAQLALAICAHALGDDQRAMRVYQRFKRQVICRLEGDNWELTDAQVLAAVERAEAERAPADG